MNPNTTKNNTQIEKKQISKLGKAHMQEIEYGSQLPHGTEGPARQLRGRRRVHERRHDLAGALLLLLRRLFVPLLLGRLRPALDHRRVRVEPRRSPGRARARRTLLPCDGGGGDCGGGCGGGLGVVLRGGSVVLGVGLRGRSVVVDRRGRGLGHDGEIRRRERGFVRIMVGLHVGDHSFALEQRNYTERGVVIVERETKVEVPIRQGHG